MDILDMYYSVFNNHLNDANTKTRKLMGQVCPKYLEELERIEEAEGGIMGIFHNSEPATAAIIYASMVTAFVNEDKV